MGSIRSENDQKTNQGSSSSNTCEGSENDMIMRLLESECVLTQDDITSNQHDESKT